LPQFAPRSKGEAFDGHFQNHPFLVKQMLRPFAASRVAIVGLGLMGASIAMDLRDHCAEIIGVSRSPETLAYARSHHIVDRITDFDSALDCDLLVLAAPVRTIITQLQHISQIKYQPSAISNQQSTVVIDLGSTKTEIVNAMQSLPARFDPIGGHPMCGKEVSGIAHAEPGLYRDKIFILTPLQRTSPAALAFVHEMIAVLGGKPLVLSAERQDALVAMISHLPYLVASTLVRATQTRNNEQLWFIAASGYRDTTRLAASDLTMMLDILLTNRTAILDALKDYRVALDTFTRLIESTDEQGLREILSLVQRQRSSMFR
jgi:prephenate dehydrogenase